MTNSSGLLTNSMVELALNFITSFSRGMQQISYLRNNNKLDRKILICIMKLLPI